MYWRIQKIGPEQIARQYGVHAVLIVSVIFNAAMFTKVAANSKNVPATLKTDLEKFSRDVTTHLFDANYLTVESSMASLRTELMDNKQYPCYSSMVRLGLIPPSADELRAVVRQMDEAKSVSCIKFDEVKLVNEPGPTTAPIMQVSAKVVVHDSQGVRPAAFKIQYTIGMKQDKSGSQTPIVLQAAVREDNSAQQQQQAEQPSS
jgi:hypothetical protein